LGCSGRVTVARIWARDLAPVSLGRARAVGDLTKLVHRDPLLAQIAQQPSGMNQAREDLVSEAILAEPPNVLRAEPTLLD
jgi:hypothetical protein